MAQTGNPWRICDDFLDPFADELDSLVNGFEVPRLSDGTIPGPHKALDHAELIGNPSLRWLYRAIEIYSKYDIERAAAWLAFNYGNDNAAEFDRKVRQALKHFLRFYRSPDEVDTRSISDRAFAELGWALNEPDARENAWFEIRNGFLRLKQYLRVVSAQVREKASTTGQAGTSADPEPIAPTPSGPSPCLTGYLGSEDLADAFGVHASRRQAFSRQLDRRRTTATLGDDCWVQVANPRPNSPKYLYRIDSAEVRALAAEYRNPKRD